MSILPEVKRESDLMKQCDCEAAVGLTKNDPEKGVRLKMHDDEELKTTRELLGKLNRGLESAREGGALTVEEAFAGLED